MAAETRFRFSEILTVSEPAVQINGKDIRGFEVKELKQIAAALYSQNEAHKALFDGEDMENGGKTVPAVIALIKKEIKRREDEALDHKIEEAERMVAAYETQEMKLKKALEVLEAAKAEKAARTAA